MASVLRVNQLDARRLDGEITSILRQQLLEATALQWSLEPFVPELDLLLKATLWRYTIWIDEPTPGGRLQNVRHARVSPKGHVQPLTHVQRIGFLVLWVIFPWLSARLQDIWQHLDVPEDSFPQRLWNLLRRLLPRATALHSILVVWNFVLFLRHGECSELRDRLLGIRMVHIDPKARRQVAFEYMNRVMIWNGLSEFLLTVMPLVNLSRLRRSLARRLLPKAAHADAARAELCCGFCGASPMTVPTRTNCNHVFCYYCVASELMEQPQALACPHCGEQIQKLRHAR
ncbi:Pex2 [Symbiodinium natans]|uniref:RING-type E3 ubiquitin transferase (cysteine targeting) n=1 Tax=Symbiodinium natans TaxID=878477 RepID=A0A812KP58_9DINO|nr:Pex2 [Symbiodinium natans]